MVAQVEKLINKKDDFKDYKDTEMVRSILPLKIYTILLDDIPQAIFTGSEKKVFVTNDIHDPPELDLPMIPLTTGNDPNIMEPDKIKENMIKMLSNSQAEDFLLLSGSKTHNSVAAAILSKMHGRINFMAWNATTKQYVLRSCRFNIEDLQRQLSTGL